MKKNNMAMIAVVLVLALAAVALVVWMMRKDHFQSGPYPDTEDGFYKCVSGELKQATKGHCDAGVWGGAELRDMSAQAAAKCCPQTQGFCGQCDPLSMCHAIAMGVDPVDSAMTGDWEAMCKNAPPFGS